MTTNDQVEYTVNDIKYAIKHNEPIEDKLHVIIVVFNPCLFNTRTRLFKEFVKRIENEEDRVNLFIVELIYNDQTFSFTEKNNKNHLQLTTDIPLWHKENLINLAVKYLLPVDYKAFAWIDADLEFESNSWALDTLKILNGCKDVVQLFSHAVNMDSNKLSLSIIHSAGYNCAKGKPYTPLFASKDWSHPGYAWAMTRKTYEQIGGLFDKCIIGGGDFVITVSVSSYVKKVFKVVFGEDFNNNVVEFEKRCEGLKFGYTPGVIKHHYHGTVENRQFLTRDQILIKHSYSPSKHITYDDKGLMIPTKEFSDEFKQDILSFFRGRKEDDNITK